MKLITSVTGQTKKHFISLNKLINSTIKGHINQRAGGKEKQRERECKKRGKTKRDSGRQIPA